MAKFSNFNTDFYGMNQFKKIMESQGVVESDDIRDFLKDSVEKFADIDSDGEAEFLDFNNGLALVINYEPGFEADDPELLVDEEGYALCVSIREKGSSHMVQEWVTIGEPVALTQTDVDEGFVELAETILAQVSDINPEMEDDEFVDRDETDFDSIGNITESFDAWTKAVNEDGTITIEDCNFGKVNENNRVNDAIVFTLKEEITDGDSASLDEYLTSFMPESIQNFCENQKFDYVVTGKHEIAFVALKD